MTRHPYIWGIFVPLIVSTLVSLFGPDIRLALSAAVRKGGNTHRRRMLMRAENRLQLTNQIHTNTYNLLLWLLAELRFPLFFSLTLPNAFAVWTRYPLLATLTVSLVYGAAI